MRDLCKKLTYMDSTLASDTDEPYLLPTNRGNKLKRKAYHIQDGVLSVSKGVKRYKRVSLESYGFLRTALIWIR